MKLSMLFAALLITLTGIHAQGVKRSLDIDDFASWKVIENQIISNNGKYIAYELNPQKGDGILIINHGGRNDTIPRGSNPEFGPGNDYVIFKIRQPEDSIRSAKLAGVKKDKLPKDSVGIFLFRKGVTVKFPDLVDIKVGGESSGWIAFRLESSAATGDTIRGSSKSKQSERKDLVLYNISMTDSLFFKDVTEYHYAKKGQAVFFIRESGDSTDLSSAIYRFDTGNGQVKELFASSGMMKKVVSDVNGNQFAFIHSEDTVKEKTFALYYGSESMGIRKIVDEYTQGIPVGWAPSEHGEIWFSDNGYNLYLGTAEVPEPEEKEEFLKEEKPSVDVWNWKDLKIQPQQKAELEKEMKHTYLAVYHTDLNRFIQLADVNVREINTINKGDADIGLGFDKDQYLVESGWTGMGNRDYYLIDFESGIKRLILRKKSYARLSPQGKYVVWYEPADSSFYSLSTELEKTDSIPLTRMIPVTFADEDNDKPMDPEPYGIAGWSEDDRFIFIYDRYDIWKIDPAGVRVPVCVTNTFGRRNKTILRHQELDKEMDYLPLEDPVMLNAFDERTKANGFFEVQLSNVKNPRLLIMDRFYFDEVKKAKNDNKIVWTKQNVKVFPDLWSSNLQFEHAEKVSDANSQQKNFIWPTVELVKWTSFSGEELEGLLYKPDNFDPNLKYPVLVYFYERNADKLHRYTIPSPSRSVINKSFYVSNGYLVFVPDITYEIGYPGKSAYNSIVSGTQYLINKYPYIDQKNIGLQGQNWGGYQTAWLITQTDIYAAAMAGAPVSNMTSAYGGIRWESGLCRMFQYEHTQSRIGGTLWEKPLQYIENSPLFHVPRIKTPLLIMHNDADGAVPWYQGIELFVAMRRMNKPVWMLTYNDEPHNLKKTSWANRVDLSRRMFQFFNHYLKDKSMPAWMDEGIKAVDKGKTLGY